MIKKSRRLKSFIKYSLFLYLVLISCFVMGNPAKAAFKFKTVVIDAGHGGKDPGAHGAYSLEKDVALSIAKKVEQLIKMDMSGIDVVMTRSSDKFVELDRRAEIANENHANLFVSIHCNSSPEGTANKA